MRCGPLFTIAEGNENTRAFRPWRNNLSMPPAVLTRLGSLQVCPLPQYGIKVEALLSCHIG